MAAELGANLLNTEDLRKRWKLKKRDTVQDIAKRYAAILKPVKIGGALLFDPANVRKFEEQQRAYEENKNE